LRQVLIPYFHRRGRAICLFFLCSIFSVFAQAPSFQYTSTWESLPIGDLVWSSWNQRLQSSSPLQSLGQISIGLELPNSRTLWPPVQVENTAANLWAQWTSPSQQQWTIQSQGGNNWGVKSQLHWHLFPHWSCFIRTSWGRKKMGQGVLQDTLGISWRRALGQIQGGLTGVTPWGTPTMSWALGGSRKEPTAEFRTLQDSSFWGSVALAWKFKVLQKPLSIGLRTSSGYLKLEGLRQEEQDQKRFALQRHGLDHNQIRLAWGNFPALIANSPWAPFSTLNSNISGNWLSWDLHWMQAQVFAPQENTREHSLWVNQIFSEDPGALLGVSFLQNLWDLQGKANVQWHQISVGSSWKQFSGFMDLHVMDVDCQYSLVESVSSWFSNSEVSRKEEKKQNRLVVLRPGVEFRQQRMNITLRQWVMVWNDFTKSTPTAKHYHWGDGIQAQLNLVL